MLELEKYYPIDNKKEKKIWDEIMNIPNNEWENKNIDREINIINNKNIPKTLRVVQLNMLPALIIEILNGFSNQDNEKTLNSECKWCGNDVHCKECSEFNQPLDKPLEL